jgi:hypothetical protein
MLQKTRSRRPAGTPFLRLAVIPAPEPTMKSLIGDPDIVEMNGDTSDDQREDLEICVSRSEYFLVEGP